MKLVSVFASLVIILTSSIAFCEELSQKTVLSTDVCFSQEEAASILLEVEKYKKQGEVIRGYKESIENLEKQVQLLQEANKLLVQKQQILESTIQRYEYLLKLQQDTYEKIIKESKPSFFGEFARNLGYMLGGVLIGIVLF